MVSTWEPGSHYDFLSRISGSGWDCVRGLIEEWYQRFPEEGQTYLLARLQSSDVSQFRSGSFELYIHETLRRLGGVLTLEPDEIHPRYQPDFLIDRGDDRFIVEVTSVGEADAEARAILRTILVSSSLVASKSSK